MRKQKSLKSTKQKKEPFIGSFLDNGMFHLNLTKFRRIPCLCRQLDKSGFHKYEGFFRNLSYLWEGRRGCCNRKHISTAFIRPRNSGRSLLIVWGLDYKSDGRWHINWNGKAESLLWLTSGSLPVSYAISVDTRIRKSRTWTFIPGSVLFVEQNVIVMKTLRSISWSRGFGSSMERWKQCKNRKRTNVGMEQPDRGIRKTDWKSLWTLKKNCFEELYQFPEDVIITAVNEAGSSDL